MTQPVPAGFGTVTPYLACSDARAEIAFLKAALGAEERHVMANPETNKVMHAEVKIGTSIVMLGDAMPESGCSKSPRDLGGSPASFYIYVPDVDAAFARAKAAGAKVTCEPVDMFWGDRMGAFECPEGYGWSVATHVHDYTPEQMAEGQRKFAEAMKAGAK